MNQLAQMAVERAADPGVIVKSRTVLIAPDKFKGSLDAPSVAAAIAQGVSDSAPWVETREVPVADGGEGTVDAALASGYAAIHLEVTGPAGTMVAATYAMKGTEVVIEMAQASGIRHMSGAGLQPMKASTFGTGELIADALIRGATDIVIGLGGSASTDGGAGMLVALGAEITGRGGIRIEGCTATDIDEVRSIDLVRMKESLRGARFTVATDVVNPLLGSHGAAAVFSPQKGATLDEVSRLELRLAAFADAMHTAVGRDYSKHTGSGSAGGTAFAAIAALEATLVSGAGVVLDLIDFDHHVAESSLVITGEGALDRQTLEGKAPMVVLERASRQGVPVIAVAGRIELSADEMSEAGYSTWIAMTDVEPDVVTCMTQAEDVLRRVGQRIGRRIEPAS